MVLPADVAFRFEEEPAHIVEGVAVTEVGAPGIAFTVIAAVLFPVIELLHNEPVKSEPDERFVTVSVTLLVKAVVVKVPDPAVDTVIVAVKGLPPIL
jgi:hypothetical protein